MYIELVCYSIMGQCSIIYLSCYLCIQKQPCHDVDHSPLLFSLVKNFFSRPLESFPLAIHKRKGFPARLLEFKFWRHHFSPYEF